LKGVTYVTFASGGVFAKFSHEFQAISEVGRTIYVSEEKKLAINKEVYNDEVLERCDPRFTSQRATDWQYLQLGTRYTHLM
jgi:hypothetical protein